MNSLEILPDRSYSSNDLKISVIDGDSSLNHHTVQKEASLSLKVARIVYKVVMLTPKYLCAGAGWAIGLYFGGNLGAGAGAATGALVGSLISFGFEMLAYLFTTRVLGKEFSLDLDLVKSLKEEGMSKLMMDRFKSACILATGCFAAGLVFNPAMNHIAEPIVGSGSGPGHSLAIGLITGFFSTSAALLGTISARKTYSLLAEHGYVCKSKKHELSKENIIEDIKDAISVCFPGEVMFMASGLPFFGLHWLVAGSRLSVISAVKAGASVTFGAIFGNAVNETKENFSKNKNNSGNLVELDSHMDDGSLQATA